MEMIGESYAIMKVELKPMKSLDASTRAQGGQRDVVGKPPARHLSLLQFFLLHTKYFELFYLKLKKVILPCYLWPIETPLVKRHGPSVDTSALILAVLPYPGREIR